MKCPGNPGSGSEASPNPAHFCPQTAAPQSRNPQQPVPRAPASARLVWAATDAAPGSQSPLSDPHCHRLVSAASPALAARRGAARGRGATWMEAPLLALGRSPAPLWLTQI